MCLSCRVPSPSATPPTAGTDRASDPAPGHRGDDGALTSCAVAMNRNTQRIVAALLVFAMIAGIVIAIFGSAADGLGI